MWLLDLRLKSLNKIYFYYTDPTSVLPYGNIRCSIENRTKHGGTGVQMPLEQNQNIRCRKNCDTNFKWSKSWAKKGNGFFQLLWSGYLCVEHQEIGISREVSLTGESGLIWHIFFFHDPTFPQRKFRWFSHVSRTQNLWAHFLDRRTDGKRWQGWPRLRRCMIR